MIPNLNEFTHVASRQGVIYQGCFLISPSQDRNDYSQRQFLLVISPEVVYIDAQVLQSDGLRVFN